MDTYAIVSGVALVTAVAGASYMLIRSLNKFGKETEEHNKQVDDEHAKRMQETTGILEERLQAIPSQYRSNAADIALLTQASARNAAPSEIRAVLQKYGSNPLVSEPTGLF